MLGPLIDALPGVLQWQNLAAMSVGTVAGILVGALPGITTAMSIAILLPLTFALDPLVALGLIAGIYNGAMYGAAIPAILLRIPGHGTAIVTTLDGYPMAQRGQAGYALQVAMVSSAIGGIMSAIALILIAPPLTVLALAFGPPEVFWLAVLGLSSVAMLLGSDPIKGWISMAIGLLLASVGIDAVTGYERFTFDVVHLVDGFHLVVVLIGLFALPPLAALAEEAFMPHIQIGGIAMTRSVARVRDLFRFWPQWLRGSIIGILVGVVPGAGGNIAAFISYFEAKRTAADPGSFGKGNPDGVAAAETATNADNAAALIPALTLGIPGNVIAALILSGLLIHGLQPGPQLFRNNPDIVYGFMLQMLFTSAMIFVFGGFAATRFFARVLQIPNAILVPSVAGLTVVGVYLVNNSIFDLYLMLGFGLLGYVMQKLAIPLAPATLGLILGGMADYNLRTSLLLAGGSPMILFNRGLSQVLIVLCLLVTIYPLARNLLVRARRARGGPPG
jgi:putative tricarboxylic transport membrane protein